jgi:solute carrier family 25 S-adenosylmethionine transporter 26
MLATKNDPESTQNFLKVIKTIYRDEGAKTLFSGVYPRTFWITIGGFIYLGTLEKVKNFLNEKYP